MKVTKYTKFISLVLVVLLLFSITPIPPNVFAETDTTTNTNETDIITTLDNQNQSQDNINTSDDNISDNNDVDTTSQDIDTSSTNNVNINISQSNLTEDSTKIDFSKYFNITILKNNIDDILTASFYTSNTINEHSTSIDTTSYEANMYYYITISPKENLSDEDNEIATNIIIQNKYLQHVDNTNKFYKNENGSIDTTTFNIEFEYVNTLDITNNIVPTHPTGHLRITQTRPELTRYAIYPLSSSQNGSRLTFNVSEMSGSPLEKTVELISSHPYGVRYVVNGYANVFGVEKKVVFDIVEVVTNTTKDFTLDNEMNKEYPLNYGRLNVKFADNDVNTQHLRIALYKDDTFLGIDDYNDGAHFKKIPFDTNYTIKAYDYDDENRKSYEIGDVGNVDINNVFELQWPDVANNVFTVPNGNYTHRSSITTSYSGNRVLHIEVCKWRQSYFNPWNNSVADLYYNSTTDTNIHNATNLLPGRYKVNIYATEDASSRHPIYTTDEFKFNEVGSTVHIDIDSLNIEDRIANYVDPGYTKIHMPFNQNDKTIEIELKEKTTGYIVDTLTNTKQISRLLDANKNYIANVKLVEQHKSTIIYIKEINHYYLHSGRISVIDDLDSVLNQFGPTLDKSDKYIEFFITKQNNDESVQLCKDFVFNIYEYDANQPDGIGTIVNDVNTSTPVEIKHDTEDILINNTDFEDLPEFFEGYTGVKVYGLELGKKYIMVPKNINMTNRDIAEQLKYYCANIDSDEVPKFVINMDYYKSKKRIVSFYEVPIINKLEIIDFDKDSDTESVTISTKMHIRDLHDSDYIVGYVQIVPFLKSTNEQLIELLYDGDDSVRKILVTGVTPIDMHFTEPSVVQRIKDGTITLDDLTYKAYVIMSVVDGGYLTKFFVDIPEIKTNLVGDTLDINVRVLDKSSNLPISGINLLLMYVLRNTASATYETKVVPITETTNGIDHTITNSHEITTDNNINGTIINNVNKHYAFFKHLAAPFANWKVGQLLLLQKDVLDGYIGLNEKEPYMNNINGGPNAVIDSYKFQHRGLTKPFGDTITLYNEPFVSITSTPSYDTTSDLNNVIVNVQTELSKLVNDPFYYYEINWYLYKANNDEYLHNGAQNSISYYDFKPSSTTASISTKDVYNQTLAVPKNIWNTLNSYRLVTEVIRRNKYTYETKEVGRLDETHNVNNNTATSNLNIELKDLSSKNHISGIKLLPLIKPIANFSADDIITVSALGGAPLYNNLTGDDDMEYTDNNVILSKDAPVQFEIASKYNNTINDNLIKVYQDKIPDGYIDQTGLAYLPDNGFQQYKGTYMEYGTDIVNNNRTITIYNEPFVTINTTKDTPIYGSTNATITINTTLDKLVPNYYYKVKIELKTLDETITLATKDDIEFVATGTTKTIEDNTFTIPIQNLVNLQNYKLIHTVERSTTNPPLKFDEVGTLKEDVAIQPPQTPVYGKPVKVRVINYDYIQNTSGINIQHNYQNMPNISFDIYKGNPTDVSNGSHEKIAENITTNSDGTFVLEDILTADNVYYLVGRENDIIENSIDKDETSTVKPFIFDVNINKDTKNTTILNVDIEGIVTDKNNAPLNTITSELIIPVYKNPNLDSNKINHTDTKVTMRVDIDVPKDVILNKYDVFKLSTDITQNNNATQSNDTPIDIDKNTVRLYLNDRKVSNGGIKNIISDNNNSFEVLLQPGRLEAARSRYVGAVARPVGYNISNRNIVDMTGTFRLSLEYDVIIDTNKLADVPLNYNATTTLSFKKIDNVARSISKTVPFELPKKSSGSTPPPPTVPGPITPKPVPPTPHTPTDPYTPYEPKDEPNDVPKDTPKDNPKDDGPKDEPKDVPNDTPNDVPTDSPKDIPIDDTPDDTPDDKDIPTDETVPELINSGSSTNYTYLIYALIGCIVMIVGSITIIHKKRK